MPKFDGYSTIGADGQDCAKSEKIETPKYLRFGIWIVNSVSRVSAKNEVHR